MPYGDPDPQDPNLLVGVSLPGDREAVREMAAAFAEEFAALGYDEERLLQLFQRRGYRAAHQAYRVLGEVEIRSIVKEALEVWGRFRVAVHEPEEEACGKDRLVQMSRRGREG